jgi:hypothetical protein
VDVTNPSQKVWVKTTYTAPRSRFTVPPQITQPATNLFLTIGETARFEATVTGGAPLSFQWQKEGGDIFGANSASLTLTNISSADAGDYVLRVFNEAQTISSAPRHLTVYATSIPVIENVIYTADRKFQFRVSGPAGLTYRIDKSTDLRQWTPLNWSTAPFDFIDDAAETQQFYRIVYPAGGDQGS